MGAERLRAPFTPMEYAQSGTYVDLTRGMRETLRRWDEIDVMTALLIPAYLREGRAVEEQYGLPVFGAWSLERLKDDDWEATTVACELIQRAYDDGYDARAILVALGADMRPRIEAAMVQFKREQPPPGLLNRFRG